MKIRMDVEDAAGQRHLVYKEINNTNVNCDEDIISECMLSFELLLSSMGYDIQLTPYDTTESDEEDNIE